MGRPEQLPGEEDIAASGEGGRKIIHIDMDAFYASVEQRDDPALKGRPVAVGGTRERGVVAAASYEARTYGVRSAMASALARRMCPDLVFVRPRFEVYREVSRQIHGIFAEFTDLIEPLSLDEAYLDVTDNHQGIVTATEVARQIRARIREETGLTASAGVSYNKFIAKLASDHNKPDGLCVVRPEQGLAFIARLAVGRFHGVGPVTATRMEKLGIHTGADLRRCSREFLAQQFGKSGDYFYLAARAIDHRPVRPDRVRKSIGSENTFFQDLFTHDELAAALLESSETVARHAARTAKAGRTVSIKLRYSDFRTLTRAKTLPAPVSDAATIQQVALALLAPLEPVEQGVRLLGVTLSNLGEGEEELVVTAEQLALAFE
ncbi:DNA polymerase IV [Sphingomonadaceae bacterium G21617-S1]|jgi:DNA polymerase-4|uniref:DNA polymerase IV n=1 Tax=Rhizorhabdus sp. TaxID=1968843 RepID=UPI0019984D6A|nr:DNA polymerase IV [Rhizorhabdus sp.]MBD3759501.1 DNA polymerase IV [Rhizorhabdus sp.]MCZ4340526.1 DNA polymerase IV [Sphingomonadaceae bacterium G21617-S1]